MVIDIPAHWMEQVQKIDWGSIRARVEDYSPALTVLRDTWDRETISQIAEGHLFVRDDVMNDAIARRLPAGGTIQSIRLTSHENGRLDIVCTTAKKYKKIELSGTIEEFVHDGNKSYAIYRVRKKNIPHHGLVSWVFSRISLSMMERMMGRLDVSERLPVEIKGNRVSVDFHEVLAASDLGTTTFQGHRLIDMIEIESAQVRDGGIMFDTKLNVPDGVKDALRALLPAVTVTTENADEGGTH